MKPILLFLLSIPLVAQPGAVIQSPANGSTLVAGSTVTVTWSQATPPASPYSFEYYLTTSQVGYQNATWLSDPNALVYPLSYGSTTAVTSVNITVPNSTGPLYVNLMSYVYSSTYGWETWFSGCLYTIATVAPGGSATASITDPGSTGITNYNPDVATGPTGPGGKMYGYAAVALPKGKIKNPNAKNGGTATIERTENEVVYVKRGDMIETSVAYKNAPTPSGSIRYSYAIDNRQVATIALGHPDGPSMEILDTDEPKNWIGAHLRPGKTQAPLHYATWGQWKKGELSDHAEYSVVSGQLPGVAPMYLQGDYDGFVNRLNGGNAPGGVLLSPTAGWGKQDPHLIARAESVWGNSVVKLVIGPVFDSQPKVADVIAAVKDWVDNYNLTFLAPAETATDAASLQNALASLQPLSQIEKDAVSALQNVLNLAH